MLETQLQATMIIVGISKYGGLSLGSAHHI